jgi:hypothetical protein
MRNVAENTMNPEDRWWCILITRRAKCPRFLGRNQHAASLGSPRSFAAQRRLAQDDNQTAPLPGGSRLDQDGNGAPYHATAAPDKYKRTGQLPKLTMVRINPAGPSVAMASNRRQAEPAPASHFETHALPTPDARFAPGVQWVSRPLRATNLTFSPPLRCKRERFSRPDPLSALLLPRLR